MSERTDRKAHGAHRRTPGRVSGRAGSLNRESIVQGAIDLMSGEGPSALTLRRLGAELVSVTDEQIFEFTIENLIRGVEALLQTVAVAASRP